MSVSSEELRAAIQQRIAGKMSGMVLLRMIAEFDHWLMPNQVLNLGNESTNVLFTDEKAYVLAQERFGKTNIPDEWLNMPGSVIFEMLAGTVDNFSVNPCSAETLSFPKPFHDTLKEWGVVVNTERALGAILQQQTEKNWKAIKAFQKYMVPVKEQPDGKALPLPAPDSKNRNLVAVFTYIDTFNAYIQSEHKGEAQAATFFSGERFFNWVRGFPCDGFVFNCCGPARPAAFARAFADEVLKHG